jgi:hypothetical protein
MSTYPEWRSRVPLVAASLPVGVVSVAIGSTATCRSLVHGLFSGMGLRNTLFEVLTVVIYPLLLASPALCVWTGRSTRWLVAVVVVSHILRSCELACPANLAAVPCLSAVLPAMRLHWQACIRLGLCNDAGLHSSLVLQGHCWPSACT